MTDWYKSKKWKVQEYELKKLIVRLFIFHIQRNQQYLINKSLNKLRKISCKIIFNFSKSKILKYSNIDKNNFVLGYI